MWITPERAGSDDALPTGAARIGRATPDPTVVVQAGLGEVRGAAPRLLLEVVCARLLPALGGMTNQHCCS